MGSVKTGRHGTDSQQVVVTFYHCFVIDLPAGRAYHTMGRQKKGVRIMANIQPNRYVLHSHDNKTKVDYETSSFIGQPVLNLTQGPGPIRHFSGSQIRTLNTEVGTLVT